MFLKPPCANDKPKSNRSQKGAFTNKLVPKIKKFVPKDEGEEGEDGGSRKPIVREKPPDTEFVAWLRAKQTSHAVHVDMAKDYILEGAPYCGDSTFDAKENIKEQGGSWHQNPDKRKDCDDKSIRRGWWSARDDSTLVKLLRMPNDDRGRRQWTPLDMGATQITFILAWLDEFKGNLPGTSTQQEVCTDDPAHKRMRTGDEKADWTGVPQWIIDANAKWVPRRVPDTKCVVCGEGVTDQFMDCRCLEAVWERCLKCGEKYRTDFRTQKGTVRNENAWCKCS